MSSKDGKYINKTWFNKSSKIKQDKDLKNKWEVKIRMWKKLGKSI